MKKLIGAVATLLAAAAKDEVFTLLVLLAFAVALVAGLVNGCESHRKNDIWEVQ